MNNGLKVRKADSGIVFLTDAQGGLASISLKSGIFLILSGLATGLSWLCHYQALLMVL